MKSYAPDVIWVISERKFKDDLLVCTTQEEAETVAKVTKCKAERFVKSPEYGEKFTKRVKSLSPLKVTVLASSAEPKKRRK